MLALHRPRSIFSFRHAPSWLLLTMAAGAVNAGAFMACRRFITHLTGSVTLLAGARTPELIFEYGIVIVCFIVGAMTSVLAIDGRYHRGKKPLYAAPLIAVGSILLGLAVTGEYGLFGPFGGSNERPLDFAMMSILSFAMGLQNAAVATSTGAVVRTTHLTGPATDLGIHLATVFYTSGAQRRSALEHALLRATKIVGFCLGGVLMLPLCARYEYLAFMLPTSLVLTATAMSFVPSWSALDAPGKVTA